MRDYELVLVLSSLISEEEQKKLLDKVNGWIEKAKGRIEEVTGWGKKTLAYPLKKQPEGIYNLLTVKLSPAEVAPLGKKILMEENILRHLLVKRE